jgi:hypothetical protein
MLWGVLIFADFIGADSNHCFLNPQKIKVSGNA